MHAERSSLVTFVVTLTLASTLASVVATRTHAQQRQQLQLSVGEQRMIPSTGVQSYSEGVEGIVDVRLTPDGSQFIVVGKRAGNTSLLLIGEDATETHFDITVGSTQQVGAMPDDGVPARDNVRLDFYFVQLSEDNRLGVGVAWPASVGGGTASASFDLMAGQFTEATAAVTDQALPRLDMAQAHGWAKLMRQAAVITTNGTEATFAGGGEVNVPVQGGLGGSIKAIEFGSKIKVLPRYDRDTGRIELALHADISDLASDQGTGVPGRITSTLDAVVNLELGQSLVIAGLTSRSEASSHSGLPGLSQIPILGVLFGTHASRSEETENLIFIVPTVVDAAASGSRAKCCFGL